jgi:aminopeptidase N
MFAKPKKHFSVFLTCLLASASNAQAPATNNADPEALLQHDLRVEIVDPASHRLVLTDRVMLPAPRQELYFWLHAGLEPLVTTAGAELAETKHVPAPHRGVVPRKRYSLRFDAPVEAFELRAQGSIHHPLKQPGAEYARSFSSTPGTIQDEGVFLSASSYWVPRIEGLDAMRFSLDVQLPSGWDAVSQGLRARHALAEGRRHVRWVCDSPQEEVYLIAAPFVLYERRAAGIQVQAYLRGKDDALAEKYLATTGQYVEMFNRLIGKYPYSKFALVENWWETGYGMPSFTLLGPKVIRFPFILHSSYPHEILHNWWGNGVYVAYEKGNWCEGLTAYLADHLIKEQRGQGREYRRSQLQRYADYVSEARDFPITEFRSRHDAATQAIGYGKMLMVFHMLRQDMGDRAFKQGLRKLYAEHLFERVSFEALEASFGSNQGGDLKSFFDQWCRRGGAPALELGETQVIRKDKGYKLRFALRQKQEAAPFALSVPVAISSAGGAMELALDMKQREQIFELELPQEPLRIDIDPSFDLFRRLDRAEIPPALSGAFGADTGVFVLPGAAAPEMQAAYRKLAEAWGKSQYETHFIVQDSQWYTRSPYSLTETVWILGWENTLRADFAKTAASAGLELTADTMRVAKETISRAKGHSGVVTLRYDPSSAKTTGWIGAGSADAIPGLIRKLPHYGKYSYLGFEGHAPDNILKGSFEAVGSPLTRMLRTEKSASGKSAPAIVARGELPKRRALAELPPAFDGARMLANIRKLAGEKHGGRGFGSHGLSTAGRWIAEQFAAAGLQPGADDGSWFQDFEASAGEGENARNAELFNVIGIIPGTDPELAAKSVVLGAHYDHLGGGWPDVRAGNEGKLHPGADDNASGIAVMLELARSLGKSLRPKRTLVFVAFSGEEAGLLGSKHYVKASTRYPAKDALAMLNLDTVGRLNGKKLTIFGTGSASEWIHVFMGVGYVTGVPLQQVPGDLGSSDQKSFAEVGVPSVQFFSGAHADYHSPRDTHDKIDVDGLIQITAVAQETLVYLVNRAQPLSSKLKDAAPKASDNEAGAQPARRVSLGSVPDFSFGGPGVRITGTTPGSPAAKAGLQKGDILLELAGTPLKGLRDLSNALKTCKPGDRVRLVYTRNGKRHSTELELVAR